MHKEKRDAEELLLLIPAVFHIFVDGERHGYGIIQEIAVGQMTRCV